MPDEISMPSPDSPPPPKSENVSSNIFFGHDGLRSGWRLLTYAALVFAFYLVASFIVWSIVKPVRGSFSYSNQFGFELIACVSVLGPTLLMSRIEGRPAGSYGLPLRSAFGKNFWWGWIFGFCEMSALVGTLSIFGGYTFGSRALSGAEVLRWGFLWLIFFLLVAFFEEFLFRGYTLYTLTEGIGFWPASIFLSLCFGAVHLQNPGENWVGVLGVVVVGLFWCFTVRRTGTLWFAVGMHVSFDFAETFLYSVPDSGAVLPGHLSNATLQGPAWLTGGTVGPEASIIDFIILAVFFWLFPVIYPSRNASTGAETISPQNS
jgi:CAAX protease family protein